MQKIIINIVFLLLYLGIQSCSQNLNAIDAPKSCFKNAYNSLDKMLTKDEKEKIINSHDIVKTHKFGFIRGKIMKEFGLGHGDSCITKHYISRGISHPVKMSALILEKYKKHKKQERRLD